MNLFVAVALGGAVGACLRYAIVLLVGHENQGFPYATLIANVLGCAAIGVLLFLIDQRELFNAHWRAFLVTGILGSLTTFFSVPGSWRPPRWLFSLGFLRPFRWLFAELISRPRSATLDD